MSDAGPVHHSRPDYNPPPEIEEAADDSTMIVNRVANDTLTSYGSMVTHTGVDQFQLPEGAATRMSYAQIIEERRVIDEGVLGRRFAKLEIDPISLSQIFTQTLNLSPKQELTKAQSQKLEVGRARRFAPDENPYLYAAAQILPRDL
jgi:hypothetical protein